MTTFEEEQQKILAQTQAQAKQIKSSVFQQEVQKILNAQVKPTQQLSLNTSFDILNRQLPFTQQLQNQFNQKQADANNRIKSLPSLPKANIQKGKEIDNQAKPTRKRNSPTIHDDILAGLKGEKLDYEAIDKREKRATLGFRKAGAALGSFGETTVQAGKDCWTNTFHNHEDDEARKAYNEFLGRWNQFQIQQAKGSLRTAEDVLGMSQKEAKEHLDYLKAELDKVAVSTVVDPDSYFQKKNQEIAEDYAYVTEDMTDGEKTVFDLYMTASEMVPVLAVGAVNPVAGGALAAGMAGGHKTYEVNAQGIGARQSFQRGVLAGAIEAATEAVPIGKIAKLVKGPSGKKAVRAIFEQMGTEATEESISYIATYVADKAYQDPNAKFSFVDLLKGAGAGMILGGVFAGGGVAVGNARGLTQTPQAYTTQGSLPHANQTLTQKSVNNMAAPVSNTSKGKQSVGTLSAGLPNNTQNSALSSKTNTEVGIRKKTAEMEKAREIAKRFNTELNFVNTLGQNIGGKYKDGKITIALDSANPVTNVLTHELTHHIESTGQYEELSNMVQAHMGEEFGSVKSQITERYAKEGIELDDAGASKEAVASFMENRGLFEDEAFVKRISIENPNLFQKIYHWIQDAVHKIGADHDAKFLIDAQRLYEKAMQQDVTSQNGTQYKIRKDVQGNSFVEIDEDILEGVPRKDWTKTVKETIKSKFSNGIDMGNFVVGLNKQTTREFAYSEYTKRLKNNSPQKYKDKLRSANNADELTKAASTIKNESLKHARRDKIKSFNRGNVNMRVGGRDYTIDVVTAIHADNKEHLYDIVNMKPTKIEATPNVAPSNNTQVTQKEVASNDNVSQEQNTVNTQYMLNDKEYTQSANPEKNSDRAGMLPMVKDTAQGQTNPLVSKETGTGTQTHQVKMQETLEKIVNHYYNQGKGYDAIRTNLLEQVDAGKLPVKAVAQYLDSGKLNQRFHGSLTQETQQNTTNNTLASEQTKQEVSENTWMTGEPKSDFSLFEELSRVIQSSNYDYIINAVEGTSFKTANNNTIYSLLDDIDISTLTNKQKFELNLKIFSKAMDDGVDTDVLVVKDFMFLDETAKVKWPKDDGFELDINGNPKKSKVYPRKGTEFDRYGDNSGRFVSPVENGLSVDFDMRGLPYVKNPNAYHKYIIEQNFSNLQRVIDNCEDLDIKNSIMSYIERHNVELKAFIGEIAPAFGSKMGGTQLQLPLPVEMLEALGMISEL